MTTWHYRIVRHTDPAGGVWIALHEVYGGNDVPHSMTAQPITFVADADEGAAGIIGALERALDCARRLPVIDVAEICGDHFGAVFDAPPADLPDRDQPALPPTPRLDVIAPSDNPDCRSHADERADAHLQVGRDATALQGTPEVCGRPVFELLFEHLAAGLSIDEIVASYPTLDRRDVLAVLETASRLLRRQRPGR